MRLSLAFLVLAASSALAQPASETVRVRLSASGASSATVSGLDRLTLDANEHSQSVNGAVQLRVDGGQVEVRADGRRQRASRIAITSEAPLRLQAERLDRRYRGALVVSIHEGRLQVVNHVPMPDYVTSVIGSEYPFSEPEGIKAQAVLARTYAARRQAPAAAFDLDDHQGAQVYKGVGAETDRARDATLATLGERLYYGPDLADAVYSSSSGGHTADNESVWAGAPVPYLRGVPDPYDADAPDHRWTTRADADRLHSALARRVGGPVRAIEIAERSHDGRVRRIRLSNGREMPGSEFRSVVNAALGARTIRSTHFELDRRGTEYVLTGRGFGHGVGLSQYGARGQAREGRTYREILAYYFEGTHVAGPDGTLASARTAPTPREAARRAADEAPSVRRRPTPRREARAQRRRGW